MNGLKYVLFIKELSLKEVADKLHVTPQAVASWSNGSRKIPTDHLETLSHFLKVDGSLLQKDVLLEDKIKLEIQCKLPGTAHYQEIEAINLYQRHELLKKRYQILLETLERTDQENRELKKGLQAIQTWSQQLLTATSID